LKKTRLGKIAEWARGEAGGNFSDTEVDTVLSDSREMRPGCAFIALPGKNFDGHNYIDKAVEAGAAAVICEHRQPGGVPFVKVEDTVRAFCDIAAGYRDQFDIPVVGVTGSSGKTTTKEMIASVLEVKYKTLKSEQSFNNYIGLSKTLLELDETYDIAVVEMGMNNPGEISRLSRMAKPAAAVINNIGMSHIGNLGSQENIFKAKLEITDGLKPDGALFLNGDDKWLRGIKRDNIRSYGFDGGNDIVARGVKEFDGGSECLIRYNGRDTKIVINIPGAHNVYNAMAAFAVGLHYNLTAEEIALGISRARSVGMRMSTREVNGIKFLLDCYNANPDSMAAAFDVLNKSGGRRKIAVLGDMLELGDFSRDMHYKTGAALKADLAVCIGDNARYIAEGTPSPSRCFDDNGGAAEFLKGELRTGDAVLIKGSRGMKLEEVFECIIENGEWRMENAE